MIPAGRQQRRRHGVAGAGACRLAVDADLDDLAAELRQPLKHRTSVR